jgi:hypothetical protein
MLKFREIFEGIPQVPKGSRTDKSIEVRSKSAEGDRQDRLHVIYIRSADGDPGSPEVEPVEGDDE